MAPPYWFGGLEVIEPHLQVLGLDMSLQVLWEVILCINRVGMIRAPIGQTSWLGYPPLVKVKLLRASLDNPFAYSPYCMPHLVHNKLASVLQCCGVARLSGSYSYLIG